MAVKLLVLLNLILLIRDVTSLCNVICTTDYATSLNCSCSGKMPISPIQVEAKCTDLEDEFVEEDIARGSNETWGGIVCGGNGERAESEKKESYQIGEKCGLLAKGGKQSDVDWQTHGHNIESERISLDSFNSNEQSEDGYPHVDLDTIDSGFGESDCSSPLNSEFNGEDQIDASVFTGEGSSSSNYVKQWMICKIAQGDATN
ncbi:interleukin 21 receptor, tandem duplicate 1 [Aplochiton taeniatus]